MTTVDSPITSRRGAGDRGASRRELAELVDRDPALLTDSARLVEDLALDSLAMMTLLTWLETRGVTVGTDQGRLITVGDVLALLDTAARAGMSIVVSNGPDGLLGPAVVPPSRPAVSPLAPVLGNSAFRLTPVSQDDIGFLYHLAVAPETGFRWRYRGAAPPLDLFVKELWAQVLVQYVVRRAGDGMPVGHVVAYSPDASVRHAYLGAAFAPGTAGCGLAAQAVEVFVRSLFHTFPLHKLYLEVPGFNWPQLASGAGRLFEVEGVLREHDFYAGRSWDKYLCAIYRDRP